MFTSQFRATTVENIAKLKARLSAPGDGEVFDRLFGVPKTDADTFAIGDHVIGSSLLKFGTLLTTYAIIAHPTCQLTRYHVDIRLKKIEQMAPNMKAFHGTDIFFTFGNKTASTLITEQEKPLIRKIQAVWIEVATAKSPEESWLPKVNRAGPVLSAMMTTRPLEECLENEAIVFDSDLKISQGLIERMTAEEIGFLRRSFNYAAE
ncbi:hypothetical protein BGX28_003056 [Mortierella sp. GBA30]|nr:hypothetical protein BGX28_003056 [Mortierella sp. GBA30]